MEISWNRLRAMFHDPQPLQRVWEQQCDYCDELSAIE